MDLILTTTLSTLYSSLAATLGTYPVPSQIPANVKLSSLGAPNVPGYGMSLIAN